MREELWNLEVTIPRRCKHAASHLFSFAASSSGSEKLHERAMFGILWKLLWSSNMQWWFHRGALAGSWSELCTKWRGIQERLQWLKLAWDKHQKRGRHLRVTRRWVRSATFKCDSEFLSLIQPANVSCHSSLQSHPLSPWYWSLASFTSKFRGPRA